MSLSYPIQNSRVIVGSKDSNDAITRTVLSSVYSDNISNIIGISGMSKVNLFVDWKSADASDRLDIRIETTPKNADGSIDRTNTFQLVNLSESGGKSTVDLREFQYTTSGGGNEDSLVIPMDISDGGVRVALKEELASGSNHGSVFAQLMWSGK